MTKLLWHSNSPWTPTGYGAQTALFAPKVAEHFDTAISAFYGLDGAPLAWKGIRILPGGGGDYGNSFLLQHAKNYFGAVKDGIIFTLMDVFVLSPQMIAQTNTACWTPIDHDPVTPGVVHFLKESGAVPIAMSRFGQDRLKAAGFDPLYVPHGVDTRVYSPRGREASREVMTAGQVSKDQFLVGCVAANKGSNPCRKSWPALLQAFAIFREKHDDALLHLHTMASPNAAAGVDIIAILDALGLQGTGAVSITPSYELMYDPFPPDTMAQLYSTFDVLLNPSMGEGFGVPILEAASCGVPSVVTNWTAMPEVAGPAGLAVGCRKHWTPGNSWMADPDVEEIVAALELIYGQSNFERAQRSKQAREHALQYDADVVFEDHFLPALKTVEGRMNTNGKVELSEPVAVRGQKVAIEK